MKTTLPEDLARRRQELAQAPQLARLAERLGQLLDPLLRGSLYLPEEKALLSRDGGVCTADGARLAFDPLSPHEHSCPACGAKHIGERHHRAWIWRYHLWLSERTIHLALLAALHDQPRYAARAGEILERYADLYPRVPNKDNVLGPTRLFFSTYLESIWLAQVVITALILETLPASRFPATGATHARSGKGEARLHEVLDPVVAESARLIGSFDEGRSNRQVWHATALLAAGIWLGDEKLRDAALEGPRGLMELHQSGVTESGMWYEGENYHLFALRGFVLGAELARWEGIGAPNLRAMHEAPLDTLLPDLTLPARGDAPYGVSVAQPRFADLWEVGWVRTESERLEAMLATLYALALPEGADPGFADIAEQEVNRLPVRLSRGRLSWKALLWMRPDAPCATGGQQARALLLDAAGIAVLRPAGRAYVSVECGGAPGGHGHPDLLHLSVFLDRPLLADFGTGSYVNPSLHWYRSAVAHNAPALAGEGQTERHGWCAALDERDVWTWCQCEAQDVCGSGTAVRRSVIAGPDWVLDVVDVRAPAHLSVDLPVHPLEGVIGRWTLRWPNDEGRRTPNAGLETGYDRVQWLGNARVDAIRAGGIVFAPRRGETLLVAEAPGPPTPWFADGASLKFLVRRAYGSGRWVQALFAHRVGLVRIEEGEIVVEGEAVHRVTVGDGVATIRAEDGSTVHLAGARERTRPLSGHAVLPFSRPRVLRCQRLDAIPPPATWADHVPDRVVLGHAAYRRAEEEYGARGPFRAEVGVFVVRDRLCFAVSVVKSEPTFRPAGAPDPALDNEAPDIHSDGVQCYVGSGDWRGWVLVPRSGAGVAVRPVAGTAAEADQARAQWERTRDGYRMVIEIAMPSEPVEGERLLVNVVINEMYPDRERRAGQLALSGGGGWVYLRGDRESPAWSANVEVV